ncbi:MAG: NTP pyrophosphohydrolases including oxidative damage repair enzymes [uncultured Friedmanniella sp.]|uniref:NTP pyrophosphohydrolases including oxidative damage repair enzymes n=1 Tax=uncultured Friedmanniella sp. TaxID=335381 RepID=A0A6J4JVB5_9ACTN|nr:MAG: NTP pyrophosphohydrolases including oxidative damage repair enzymes [uncultured Friedmanniella sp.]
MGQDGLERFVRAQDEGGTYATALAELRRGRKVSHWMWFVFPQLAGLGRSSTAQHFALASLAEARAYLAHPELGPRLREAAAVLAELPEVSADDVLGPVDAVKLRSSMTLFARAAPAEPVFPAVLDRFFGGRPDAATDRLLAG